MAKSLKMRVLGAALVGAISVMGSPAQADVLATSVLRLSNLTFSKTGGAILSTSDFSTISYENSGDTSSSFTGQTSAGSAGVGTPLDLALACSGPCGGSGLANNNFLPLNVVTGSFAAGDQNESGFPISGLGSPVGATVESGAWAQAQAPGGGVGSGTANNGLTARIVFVANFSGTVDIDADFIYYFNVTMSAGEAATSFTQSRGRTNFNLVNLTDTAVEFDFSPTALNWNWSITGPEALGTTIANGAAGALPTFTTPTLVAGKTYLLTATLETLADVRRTANVPEPATLALAGLGLLGLALGRRRAISKK
jgi:hypothetical protein